VRRRLAERGDQGGDPLELIALRVEIEGAEADDDVARSGRDIAVKALCHVLGVPVMTAWIFSSSASGMP
jgi:hypothetical protein